MRLDRVQKLVVGQRRVGQAKLGEGRALFAEKRAEGFPVAAASAQTVSRLGGVFRYSMMVGSIPAARIRARVLREVPQAGLW